MLPTIKVGKQVHVKDVPKKAAPAKNPGALPIHQKDS